MKIKRCLREIDCMTRFYDGKYFDTLYAKIKQNDIAVKNEPIHDV